MLENCVANSVQEQLTPVPQRQSETQRRLDAKLGSALLLARLLKHHTKDAPPGLQGLAQVIQIPTEENITAVRNGYPSVQEIIVETAKYYHVRPLDVISERRPLEITIPRHVAMWLSREMTPLSLPTIGRCFGRDHTTVLNGIRQIEKKRRVKPRLQDDLDVIRLHVLDRLSARAA
jgi:hypothetical protein